MLQRGRHAIRAQAPCSVSVDGSKFGEEARYRTTMEDSNESENGNRTSRSTPLPRAARRGPPPNGRPQVDGIAVRESCGYSSRQSMSETLGSRCGQSGCSDRATEVRRLVLCDKSASLTYTPRRKAETPWWARFGPRVPGYVVGKKTASISGIQ